MLTQRGALIALVVLLVATFVLYYPGSEGPYLLDDKNVLLSNPAFSDAALMQHGAAPAAYSFNQGGRALSMFSFALNYRLAGNQSPYSIKFTNILLHLLQALLLYSLGRRLYPLLIANWHGRIVGTAECRNVALLAMALWLLHPLHVSTVLYAVQRMAMLSALFITMGLLLYLEGRAQLLAGRRLGWFWLFAAFGMAGGAAMLSKENGALIVFFSLLIEVTCLQFRVAPSLHRYTSRTLLVFLAIPSVILAGLILRYLFLPDSFLQRDFTVSERLLTESRILLFYLSELFYPAVERMGLYWGGEEISRGLLQPVTTLFSVVVMGGALVAALFGVWRKQGLMFAFALLWFLVGHAIESTAVPLELIFEHRNYLASYGWALLMAWLLFSAWRLGSGFKLLGTGGAVVLLLLLVLAGGLAQRVAYWRTADGFYLSELQREPRSARLWESYGLHLERSGRYMQALSVYREAAAERKEDVTFSLAQWYLLRSIGEPVPPLLVERAIQGLERNTVSRGAIYNLVRLLYGCGAAEDRGLELALGSAVHNTHWYGSLWREFGMVLLSDYYRRYNNHRLSEQWMQRIPDSVSMEAMQRNREAMEKRLSAEMCP